MTLVDTSVWIDFLARGDFRLQKLLETGEVLMHPMILGEIACGRLVARRAVLDLLRRLPEAVVATDSEALRFLEVNRLHGRGVGWVDVHLLASTALTVPARLLTRDRALAAAASDLGLGA